VCRHQMNDLGSSQRVKSFQVLIFYHPLFALRPSNSKPKRTDRRLLVITPIDPHPRHCRRRQHNVLKIVGKLRSEKVEDFDLVRITSLFLVLN
jgi:hypothetical protein